MRAFFHRQFVFISGFFAITLGACETERAVHGRIVTKEDLACLNSQLGTITEQQVYDKLGPASCVLNFDPHTWYYLNLLSSRRAFFHPTINENKSVVLLFSPKGVLYKILHPTQMPVDFRFNDQATRLPSSHRDTFLADLFRNAGRFTKTRTRGSKAPF
jgi:outer membrane protein assembly factor BamE (lipoprotein component of BamABCDE complex)